jgi:hypothetical protein
MSMIRDRVLSGLFLLVLFLPTLMAGIFREKPRDQLQEKRRLAEMPRFPIDIDATEAFPRRFEAYFNDHFKLRETLIRSHNRLKIKLLKESPQRDVLMGRDGWLFFARNHVLEDFLALEPFSQEELNERKRLLEAKRDWLASQGIAYLFVVAPNKQSIYPEYMPEGYTRSQGVSRLDQLIDYLRAKSDIAVVDLRTDLRVAKSNGAVYFSTDTHWNPEGSFIAYRRIMKALQQLYDHADLTPRSSTDYRRVSANRKGGDLAKMLGIQADVKEAYDQLLPLFTTCAQDEVLPDYMNHDWKPFPEPVARNCPSGTLRLVMLHDSFGKALRPLLSEHFQRSVFVWQNGLPANIFKAVVLKEKPDIVIEEVVERMIYYMQTGPEYMP